MPTYNKESNTYNLSYLDKFRLFEIKHKWVENIALFSTFLMPFLTSIFTIGYFAIGIGLLIWWLLSLDHTIVLIIVVLLNWIIGIVLGIIGQVPFPIWVIYFPLLINAIYYLICEWLENKECKNDETPLEILYKQHKIK